MIGRSASSPAAPAGRRTSRRGRGTLLLIASLLLGSAGLRLALGAEGAMARAAAAGPVAAQEAEPPAGCTPEADIASVLDALKEREARLDAREREIGARLQALNVADREIERKMAELVAAEDRLRATLAIADEAAEGDLTRLTAVYENMKPKQAAALFEQMDPTFAAGFIGRMRPDAAAEVMAGLTPETAYTVSVVLAGRNAEAPTE